MMMLNSMVTEKTTAESMSLTRLQSLLGGYSYLRLGFTTSNAFIYPGDVPSHASAKTARDSFACERVRASISPSQHESEMNHDDEGAASVREPQAEGERKRARRKAKKQAQGKKQQAKKTNKRAGNGFPFFNVTRSSRKRKTRKHRSFLKTNTTVPHRSSHNFVRNFFLGSLLPGAN